MIKAYILKKKLFSIDMQLIKEEHGMQLLLGIAPGLTEIQFFSSISNYVLRSYIML